MSLRIVQASEEHLISISPRPEFKLTGSDKMRLLNQLYGAGGFSVIDEANGVLAMFGASFINQNTVQAWALVSLKVRKRPLEFHKLAIRLLRKFERDHGVNRIQMTVRADFPAAHKWALALGFECEGKLRKYGPDGSDFFLYAKVK